MGVPKFPYCFTQTGKTSEGIGFWKRSSNKAAASTATQQDMFKVLHSTERTILSFSQLLSLLGAVAAADVVDVTAVDINVVAVAVVVVFVVAVTFVNVDVVAAAVSRYYFFVILGVMLLVLFTLRLTLLLPWPNSNSADRK